MTPPSKGYTTFNGGPIEHWKVARKRTKKAPTAKPVRTATGWRIEYREGGIARRSPQEWATKREAEEALERKDCEI